LKVSKAFQKFLKILFLGTSSKDENHENMKKYLKIFQQYSTILK